MADNDHRTDRYPDPTPDPDSAHDPGLTHDPGPAHDFGPAHDPDPAPAVIDDPDVPVDPDDRTRAEADAATAAVYALPSAAAARRNRRGPRSVLLLVLVIVGVFGLGVYAVVWSDRLRVKNERIQLRELERRHVMAGWQERNRVLKFGPGSDIQPAGVVYKPLAPGERARYDALVKQHGSQFEPTDIERALIDETKQLQAAYAPPAAGPATGP